MSRASFWSWLWIVLAFVAMITSADSLFSVAVVCSTVWAAADWLKTR